MAVAADLVSSAPLVGVDDETYLRGVQVFLDAQGAAAVRNGGLQLAAFWVGIRQEFHTSFIKQRIFQFDLSCCDHSTYRLLDQADDPTWANRVILHCAHTLMYCYDERSHTIKEYEQLWDYSQGWNRMAPPTFNPIYFRPPDRSKGEVFPELWFLDDCIGINQRPCACERSGAHTSYTHSDCHSTLAPCEDSTYCIRSQSPPSRAW